MFPLRNIVLFLEIATVFVAIVAMWPRTDTSGIDVPLPEGVFDIPRFVRGAHLKEFVPNTTAIEYADEMPFVNISTKEQLLSAMRSTADLQSILHYIGARLTHGNCETESILYIARLFAFFWPGMRRYEDPPKLWGYESLARLIAFFWPGMRRYEKEPKLSGYKSIEMLVLQLVQRPALLGEDYEWHTDKGKDYLNRCLSLAREIIYKETVLGIPFPE